MDSYFLTISVRLCFLYCEDPSRTIFCIQIIMRTVGNQLKYVGCKYEGNKNLCSHTLFNVYLFCLLRFPVMKKTIYIQLWCLMSVNESNYILMIYSLMKSTNWVWLIKCCTAELLFSLVQLRPPESVGSGYLFSWNIFLITSLA